MIKQRKIELLAPAKNMECGIEAINHGADAVYIGAPKFGARAAAGNSLEDIAALVAHAHLYNARIYVTVNTILKEEELAETEKMIWDLHRAQGCAFVLVTHAPDVAMWADRVIVLKDGSIVDDRSTAEFAGPAELSSFYERTLNDAL